MCASLKCMCTWFVPAFAFGCEYMITRPRIGLHDGINGDIRRYETFITDNDITIQAQIKMNR